MLAGGDGFGLAELGFLVGELLPATHADGVGRFVGSVSAMFLNMCWS
jgi:hypothetical protein